MVCRLRLMPVKSRLVPDSSTVRISVLMDDRGTHIPRCAHPPAHIRTYGQRKHSNVRICARWRANPHLWATCVPKCLDMCRKNPPPLRLHEHRRLAMRDNLLCNPVEALKNLNVLRAGLLAGTTAYAFVRQLLAIIEADDKA